MRRFNDSSDRLINTYNINIINNYPTSVFPIFSVDEFIPKTCITPFGSIININELIYYLYDFLSILIEFQYNYLKNKYIFQIEDLSIFEDNVILNFFKKTNINIKFLVYIQDIKELNKFNINISFPNIEFCYIFKNFNELLNNEYIFVKDNEILLEYDEDFKINKIKQYNNVFYYIPLNKMKVHIIKKIAPYRKYFKSFIFSNLDFNERKKYYYIYSYNISEVVYPFLDLEFGKYRKFRLNNDLLIFEKINTLLTRI